MASQAVPKPSETVPQLPPITRIGRRCTVCDHPHRSEIDKILVTNNSGVPYVSRQYGLSKSALHRHKKTCVPLVIESELREIAEGQPADPSPIALIAKDARLRRLQRYADAQDRLLEERGLLYSKVTVTPKSTTKEDFYNGRIIQDAVLIHDAIRAELGETMPGGGRTNNTVVFFPGSLAPATVTAARGLLAEAAEAARAAVEGPATEADRVSLEGRKGGNPGYAALQGNPETDIELIAEPIEAGEDTRERSLSGVPSEPPEQA